MAETKALDLDKSPGMGRSHIPRDKHTHTIHVYLPGLFYHTFRLIEIYSQTSMNIYPDGGSKRQLLQNYWDVLLVLSKWIITPI